MTTKNDSAIYQEYVELRGLVEELSRMTARVAGDCDRLLRKLDGLPVEALEALEADRAVGMFATPPSSAAGNGASRHAESGSNGASQGSGGSGNGTASAHAVTKSASGNGTAAKSAHGNGAAGHGNGAAAARQAPPRTRKPRRVPSLWRPRSGDPLENNLETCSTPDLWLEWFDKAEQTFEEMWSADLWPTIKSGDFTTTLEIGPGAGRNSEKLSQVAKTLHLVDLNSYALDCCRERLADFEEGCDIQYHQNDGLTLPFLADGSITFIYSWDTVVHFDSTVVASYVREFARVLAPGGKGFVHHSNHGARSPETNIELNPHMRSDVSKDLFRELCEENGLEIIAQNVIEWEHEPELDCLTMFRKPAATRRARPSAGRQAEPARAPRSAQASAPAHRPEADAGPRRPQAQAAASQPSDPEEERRSLLALERENRQLRRLLADAYLEKAFSRDPDATS